MQRMMLINASHEEESRVAIVEQGYLQELDIESAQKALTKGNIYKGTITKVEASLQAAFVEYGSARQGFLPLSEIHTDYWKEGADKDADIRRVNIQDVVAPKQQILIQVVKEERGNKGAALTSFISLAGRYLVLSPNTSRGGISRKLSDEERRAMKEILSQLNVPENMGLILRTAGKDQTLESLQWDYSYLSRLWDEIRIKGDTAPSPSLIYLEGDLATRAIRDHFTDDIGEIWVDNHDIYTRTKNFVHAVLPGKEKLVKLYRGKKPLFRQYGVEAQCEEIHEREIRLPSGGSIVFDPTEALTSIDVNSSRSTAGKHIDDTALATNLEAAEEVARQLRIRDIGGLVVIDFIDMASRKHGQQVEEVLRKACQSDKARIQFARISRFGLLEMSRQRLHPSVRESTTETCPRCQGRGSVRTVESMALQMLTRIEDLAEAGNKPTLVVQVPSETGEYLMNNKRDHIARIEELYEVQVTLQIRQDLVIPHYRIERQWTENNQQRVDVLEDTTKNKKAPRPGRKLKPLSPVVGIPTPQPERPAAAKEAKKGWISALLETLFGGKKKKQEEAAQEEKKSSREERPRRRRNNDRRPERGERPAKEDRPRKKPVVDGEGSEANAEDKPRKPRRSRNRRKRPEGERAEEAVNNKPLQEGEAASDAPVAEKANAEGEGNAEGETKRRRPRRRRRRPAGENTGEHAHENAGENAGDGESGSGHASAEAHEQKQESAASGEEGEKSKPRRPRRRRSPRKAEGEGATEQASGESSSGNKEARQASEAASAPAASAPAASAPAASAPAASAPAASAPAASAPAASAPAAPAPAAPAPAAPAPAAPAPAAPAPAAPAPAAPAPAAKPSSQGDA